MNASEALKQWKTDAWKDPGMVAHYSAQMFDNSGTNRLNNLLETGLIAQYVSGDNVLDVGVGTGRASIPLAKRGLSLTGVDSSQSMLDETRRLAGDTPFELLLGDVGNLPVADGAYDSLISLNVMTHFANWREILAHWAGKVKDGGRLIFDVYSLDHLEAAAGHAMSEEDLLPQEGSQNAFAAYNLRVKTASLVAAADALGLTVKAIVPYRGFMCGPSMNLLLKPYLDGEKRWERFLSWLESDDQFLNSALFLERHFVAHLTSKVAVKMMVVFDKRSDQAANQAFIQSQTEMNRLMVSGMTLAQFAAVSGQDEVALREGIAQGLSSLRGQALLYRVLLPLLRNPGLVDIKTFLGEEGFRKLRDWLNEDMMDVNAIRVCREWRQFADRGEFVYSGVELAPSLEYNLFQALLVTCYGLSQ